jgi:hypothetical protein
VPQQAGGEGLGALVAGYLAPEVEGRVRARDADALVGEELQEQLSLRRVHGAHGADVVLAAERRDGRPLDELRHGDPGQGPPEPVAADQLRRADQEA